MTRTTGQSGRGPTGPTAQPKPRPGARACRIAFLHVCLPTAVVVPCQGRWEGMGDVATCVAVSLPMESPAVVVPIHHALPEQSF